MISLRRSKGFTLIELLVVIAIIAILAAILFPVFANARKSAQKASCLSNLKQLALAFNMYTNDNKGKFPPGSTNDWNDDGLWWFKVDTYIKQVAGGTGIKGIYLCPASPKLKGNNENVRRCYGYNFQYLGGIYQAGDQSNPSSGNKAQPLSSVEAPATTILLLESWRWDAAAFTATTPKGIGSAFCYPPVKTPSICRPDYVWPPGWHSGGSNAACVDGHVMSFKVPEPRQTPESPTPGGNMYVEVMMKGGAGTPYDDDPWFRLDGRKP